MSLTLVEALKLAVNNGEEKRAAVIAMFARASDILMALPFKDIQGNAYSYNQEGTLPSVAFRGVNESYTASTGIVNPATESLRICGGDLDVDKFIIDTNGMAIRATHEELKVKALAAEITRVLIKGDSTSNPREFDGLQNRITGSQLIAAGTTDAGDALSLTKLDELIDAVPGITHLIMNKALRRRLTAASRNQSVGGHVSHDINEFGRRVTAYNDIPILVPYSDNGGTEPLAFDEQGDLGGTPGGTSSSSIYGVAFGDGLVTGLQSSAMDVRDLGELETTPAFRTRVEWYAGLCVEHGRAAARLGGIADAAVVA
ncbi:MAG: major capsid protein [Mycobacterium sp.]